ncbi:hypothetical protein [Paenibacillus sp. J23TS9]|nr:hypothetical protein [Paenibacillus sp. J23TS9]
MAKCSDDLAQGNFGGRHASVHRLVGDLGIGRLDEPDLRGDATTSSTV